VLLRLAFDPDFAPLTFLAAGEPAGRAVEIVREACAQARIDLELVPVELGLRDGPASPGLDGHVCMAITPRRAGIHFSVPYLKTAAAVFFRRRDVAQVPSFPFVLSEAVVITPRAGPLFDDLNGAALVVRVVPGTGYRDCLERVLRGEADAAVLNGEVAGAMVARLFPREFETVSTPLPDLGLAVGLTGEAIDANVVLSLLNPALATVGISPAACDR
jgi:polar amino acid transport system substrate-binding protein